jgi:hypothetical protein
VRGAADVFADTFGVGRGLSAAQRAEREARECAPHPFVDGNGNVRYYLNNDPTCVLHREDGPALVGIAEGGAHIEEWYRQGELHREDGVAALETSANSGTVIKSYYQWGQLHREGGPARIETRADGTLIEHWYREGERHREDGPAIRCAWGEGPVDETYYLFGELQGAGPNYKLPPVPRLGS